MSGEYVVLLGAEDVARAGHNMAAAAAEMTRAACQIDETMRLAIQVWREEIAPALERLKERV